MSNDLIADMAEEAEKDQRDESTAAPEALAELVTLGEELEDTKNLLDSMKKETKEVQARYDELRGQLIPDAMHRAQLVSTDGKGKFSLSSGAAIHLRPDMFVGVDKANEPKLLCWLDDNGHGDLARRSVNRQTLRAFVKEQMDGGKEIPRSILNIHDFTTAVLSRTRSKK
jgi:hypothetical protein